MVGILGGSLNPEKQKNQTVFVGSQVAGEEWEKAMLRYAPERSLTLFVADRDVELMRSQLRRLAKNEFGGYAHRQVLGLSSFPPFANANGLTACHDYSGAYLHRITYLRSCCQIPVFPATCLVHGFSYQSAFWDCFARLAISPLYPCDSVICTTEIARTAFVNCLEQTREGLCQVGLSPKPFLCRTDIIPLGVDTDIYRPRDKQDARRLLGLPLDGIIILYFGRLDIATKADLIPLLLALKQLKQSHSGQLSLVLAGNAVDTTVHYLQALATEFDCAQDILIRHAPSLSEGPTYYSAADIFVGLSDTLQESFGIAPLEAMASGLPVVVSDWSGYRETVLHEVTGFRVPTYWADCDRLGSFLSPFQPWNDDHLRLSQTVVLDNEKLIYYLGQLIVNSELRRSMGNAARQHVMAHFTWKEIVDRYFALWTELASIAATLSPSGLSDVILQQPRSFRNFQHYATRRLTGTEVLEITSEGIDVLKRQNLILVSGADSILQRKLLFMILRFTRILKVLRFRATIDQLSTRVAPKGAWTKDVVLVHILWLLKHSYLTADFGDRH